MLSLKTQGIIGIIGTFLDSAELVYRQQRGKFGLLWTVMSKWTHRIIGMIVDSAEFVDTVGTCNYCGQ